MLTAVEMSRFWDALDRFGGTSPLAQEFPDVIGPLALTGARRTEVLAMEWDEIDLDAGIWKRPAEG